MFGSRAHSGSRASSSSSPVASCRGPAAWPRARGTAPASAHTDGWKRRAASSRAQEPFFASSPASAHTDGWKRSTTQEPFFASSFCARRSANATGAKIEREVRASIGGEGFYEDFYEEEVEGLASSDQLEVQKFTNQGVRVWLIRSPQRPTFVAAEIEVNATVSEVWEAVNDYARYSEVFKNVSQSTFNGSAGVVDLGLEMQSVYWKAKALARLEVEEEEDGILERKQVNFNLAEGDFDGLRGRWVVEWRGRTMLRLEFEVSGLTELPRTFADHIVRQGIPSNIKMLAKRVELSSLRTFADQALAEPYVDIPGANPFDGFQSLLNNQKQSVQATRNPYQYLGVSEVPLPSGEYVEEEGGASKGEGGVRPQQGNRVKIHLRKLDNDEYIHSRVIASIDIKATKAKVWGTLTDYERLPTILPNLVHSKAMSSKTLPGRLKLRQIVFKEFMYLRFRAEAVLDVLEKPFNEIQFQLSNGPFDMLQGKFLLQRASVSGESGADADAADKNETSAEEGVSLVYAVEVRIPRGIQTFAVAPLIEKFAFEDVANNMEVLRKHIESASEETENEDDRPNRPPTSVLCSDIEVLKVELKRTFGEGNTTMPKKGEFRSAGRFDLEKACYAHGGFSTVAQKIGWKMQYRRKPRDYWQNFDNLRTEIAEFIEDHNLNPKEFPARQTFIREGRMDIVRAYTKWGGPVEVAASLGLRPPN